MVRKLSLIWLVIGLFALTGCVVIDFTDGSYDYKEYDEKIFEKSTSLILDNFQGGVIVEPARDGKVKVQYEKFLRGDTEDDLREASGYYSINFNRTSSTLIVETSQPKVRPTGVHSAWIAFRIFLPVDMTLRVKTANGSINVSGIKSSIDLKSSNGSITVTNHAGEIEAETSNAAIDIEHAVGQIDVDTSNGHISVRDFKGEIKGNTSNGRIQIETENPVTHADLSTSNGTIVFNADTVSTGDYELRTSNGPVKVYLNPKKGYNISAKTSNGRIQFRFPIEFSGTYEKNYIRGKIGGGGAEFDINTSNGEISFEEWGSN